MKWRETTLEDLLEFILDEDLEGQKKARAEFIKNKFGPQWKGLPGYEDMDAFLEKLGEVDPSLKGIYMPWIARLAISNPQENKTEDLDRLNDDLVNFERVKARLANKDINAYKSFHDLYSAVAPLMAPAKKSPDDLAKEKEAARLAAIKGQITTVYNGPEGWIRIPETEEAACFLGQNTRWCTASNKSNMFNHYNRSDVLFVVYDKATKARSQLHIESGQFAGEDDRNKGITAIPEWARQPIIDWYKSNNPQLSVKKLVALSSISDENLAAGTDLEVAMYMMYAYSDLDDLTQSQALKILDGMTQYSKAATDPGEQEVIQTCIERVSNHARSKGWIK